MLKYRKKPIVIEAEQLDDSLAQAQRLQLNSHGVVYPETDLDGLRWNKKMVAKTLEGKMYGNVGDWCIIGIKGEMYFCKDDIFKATYEAVS